MLGNSTASNGDSAVRPLENKVDLSADVFTQKRLESIGSPSRSLIDKGTFSYPQDSSPSSTKEMGHVSPNRIFNANPGLIRSPKLSSYSDDASGHLWRATEGDLASYSLDSKDKEKDGRALTPTHHLAGDLPRSWPLDEESRDRKTWTDLMKKSNDQQIFKMQSWPGDGLAKDTRGGSLLSISKASSPDRFRQPNPSSFPPRVGGAPEDTQGLDEYFRKMAITPRSPNRPAGFDSSESLLGTGHGLPPSPQRQGLQPPPFENDDMRQQAQGKRFSSGYGHEGLLHGSQGSHRNLSMIAPEPAPVVSGFDGFVYKVQFKRKHRNFLRSSAVDKPLNTGDFVIVEADRGEDLGVICDVLPMPVFFREGGSLFGTRDGMGRVASTEKSAASQGGIAPGTGVKHILRHALPQEYSLLPIKMAEEEAILEVCRERALGVYLLPMSLVDAEYQFDRHKLTVYYESNRRIDFRELVRDIFTIYKTRIWMEHVSYSFRPHDFASRALSSGVPVLPSEGPTSTPQLSLSSPSPDASPTGVQQQHGRPQGSGYFQYGSGTHTSPYAALYGQRPAASGFAQSPVYTDGFSYDSGHGNPISPTISTGYAHTTAYAHLYGGDITASMQQQQMHAQIQAQARGQLMQGPVYGGSHGTLVGAYSRNPYATQGEVFADNSLRAHAPVYGSADMYGSYQPLQYPSTASAAPSFPQSSTTHQGQSLNPPQSPLP